MNNNNSDISSRNRETLDQGNQIFSVGGTPSFRLNRREQATSNVFPAGCMGSRSIEEASTSSEEKIDLTEAEIKNENEDEVASGSNGAFEEIQVKQVVDEAKIEDAGDGYVWKRNPLTGQGVEVEEPRSSKKSIKKKLNKWVW